MEGPLLQSWEVLEELPATDFFRLYQHPSSVLAIFRKRLTELGKWLSDESLVVAYICAAQCFVMAMLYMRAPLPAADLELWVKPGNTR